MNDLQIRNVIKGQELKRYINDPHTRVIDEFGICQGESIVDIAVVNGSMHGYEIKSDIDTLRRLPKQVENYSKVFDFVSIVTSKKYADIIASYIPEWWGIVEVNGSKSKALVIKKRLPLQNALVDVHSLVQLLWKDELVGLIDKHQLGKAKKYKPKYEIWAYIAERVNEDELKSYIRQCLKARTSWKEF